MNKSESTIEIAKALTTFQGILTSVKKDAINPFFKSKYATLDTIWDTIRKPLTDNGLSITQTMGIHDNTDSVLTTTLYHTSGEWISGEMLLNPVKNDPQGLGSAVTYARRYSISAMLGVVADEDDDANTATKTETAKDTTEPMITTPQTKKIYASVKEKGITPDQAKDYIKKTFNKHGTKELTTSEASRLIEDIEAGKLKQEVDSPLAQEAMKLGAVKEE